MRENRPSGSEGGEAEINRPSLPLSNSMRCASRNDHVSDAETWNHWAQDSP